MNSAVGFRGLMFMAFLCLTTSFLVCLYWASQPLEDPGWKNVLAAGSMTSLILAVISLILFGLGPPPD